MNCAVCGNPLLSSRSAFRCSCGVFVHAYCWDKHVLQAHQPVFEMGTIDLEGEFQLNEDKAAQAPVEQIAQPAEAAEEATEGVADEAAQALVEQSAQPAEAAEEVAEGAVDEAAQAPAEQVTHSPQKQKKKKQKKKKQ